MLHSTSCDWLSRLAAFADRSSFADTVLPSLFLKTPGPLSRSLPGWILLTLVVSFSVFLFDLSAASLSCSF